MPGPARPSPILCRLLPVAFCALLLAACEGLSLSDPDPEPKGTATSTEKPAVKAGTEQTGAAETVPAETAPAPQVAVIAPPAPEAVPVPEPAPLPGLDDDPAQLIGLGTASLAAILGAPAQIRRETPANIWQYRAEGCVLDVVLYPEKGIDRVNYVEARANGLEKMPARDCLNKVLRLRRGLPAG